jgi:hypothetical protein
MVNFKAGWEIRVPESRRCRAPDELVHEGLKQVTALRATFPLVIAPNLHPQRTPARDSERALEQS